MKNILLYFILIVLSFNIIGCSNDDVTIQDNDAPSIAQQDELVQLKDVISELMNNELLVPIGEMPIPDDNPMSEEVIELGQILFFDPRLSGNNEVSCATCHDPLMGYGDNRPTFETITGDEGTRNSQTIINSGYYDTNFWDGRAASLEEQALGPIENPNEMDQSLDELIIELQAIDGYEELFLAAFDDGITKENIGKALAAFERLIVVKDTPYDRFLRGEHSALSASEIRGLDLFAGKAFCITCHNGENLSDNQFYNLGILTDDEGRFAVTGDQKDIGRIRTPGLYGIAHTAPYMRDGRFNTLEEVLDFYIRGGEGHPNTSMFMKMFMSELVLTEAEKSDLISFLKALSGEPPIFEKPPLPGIDR